MPTSVVTLTLNPTIDISYDTGLVAPEHKTRTGREQLAAGGGGINVARMLRALGAEATAVMLAGGVTGRLIETLLEGIGLRHRVIPIADDTRICTTICGGGTASEYRFVPEGPRATEAECHALLAAIEATECEWLVASGSILPGMPDDIYACIARLAARRGQHFVLDTSGPALRAALHADLALLKMSLSELEALVGHRLTTRTAREAEAFALVRSGAARMVALTLGAEGSILATAEEVHSMAALPAPVRTTVGAGDAFLAGMVLALSRGAAPRDALGWGSACAAASVAQVSAARVSQGVVPSVAGWNHLAFAA
jgi:6-phosphofructokinase 2